METELLHRRLDKQTHQKMQRNFTMRQTLTAVAFLAPAAVFFVAFLLVPAMYLFYLTFHTGGIITPAEYVGLQNWREIWSDDLVRTVIWNTVKYCLIAIPAVFIIAMIYALCLEKITRLNSPIRAIIYIPVLTPYVIAALIWLFMFQRDFGFLNVFLGKFGVEPRNWLGDPDLVIPSIAMLEVWRGVGFWTILFLAALLAIPPDLYKSATMDGANVWQRFIYITLPMMRPTFFFAVVMATIFNLQLFDSVSILTDGGPQNASATVVWYIYKAMFQFNDMSGFSAALSFVLLLFIMLLTLIEVRLLRAR